MGSKMPEKEKIDLIEIIDSRLKSVHTQSLDISFNELLDMYLSGELDISPDYQRLFQWSEGARSRFVESLLLEMPIPPIFVIEEDGGRYSLIDGLQRISAYLHFRGKLKATHLDPPVKVGDMLKLCDCDIIQEFNGLTFDDLPTALQIRLKRSFIRVEVVRRGSDPHFKYHMFKRLNTGGELLSEQQIRNCTIRLLNSKFNDFIIELSRSKSFINCTEMIGVQRKLIAFDQELVLRFFALKNNLKNFKHDVADFLTDFMEQVSDPNGGYIFDYEQEKKLFNKTFLLFEKTLAERSFSLPSKNRKTLTKGFGIYHYEAFTLGVQPFIEKINIVNHAEIKKLKDIFLEIKCDQLFINLTTGGGKNSPGPLNSRINFVTKKLIEHGYSRD
ncbi:DUF262 domain-containing protein [Desulfolutivibrio sulfoxidireducens]|uniref:DUF262 domain-containing protein n=1 Tax=Desulfolutivibrio sulfoxidireducens TaxID=2773299 RepID=UPI00159EAD55|nr:DUF262 domain-containing protein [Desulfolutivibrio sulfoxidireducens]QLA18636.1 DUF262 domain-containing protein [Desulfolutivibrio sulfoxidireducens]